MFRAPLKNSASAPTRRSKKACDEQLIGTRNRIQKTGVRSQNKRLKPLLFLFFVSLFFFFFFFFFKKIPTFFSSPFQSGKIFRADHPVCAQPGPCGR